MRILMLLDSVFPPDIRVEKEVRTLLRAGHELFILSPGVKGRPDKEMVQGVQVIRRKAPESFVGRAASYLSFQATFTDHALEEDIARVVREEAIQTIHAHDLPSVKVGLSVAERFYLPLVADLHENYPEAQKLWRTNWKEKGVGLISPVWRWKQMEKSSLRRATRIITVVDEAKEHYTNDCGILPEKITVVMNVEDNDFFCSLPVKEDILARYAPYSVISYIGGFGRHRGLETAILAVPKILEEVPNARLLLVGSGANEAELRELAAKAHVAGEVEFTGWQPLALVRSFILASRVCLVPHVASPHTDTTIPHKLLQYMALARPVVVSNAKPLARIVRETQSGLVYKSENADELAASVIRLLRDKKLACRLGTAGQKAVNEKYNWQREGEKLVSLYEAL